MIELRNFATGYGDRILLDNVNITIGQGELTALIGRNGTGKSTLLRAIAGLSSNYRGEIICDGTVLKKVSPAQLATLLSFVSTERIRIPNLLCRDVVAMGRAPYTDWIGRLNAEDETIVEQSLASVGMSGYANRTMDSMSDGECQRVMIARALAQSTPVMILDEPTSFLDMPNRYELCTLLARLAHDENKCILFSTHELDIAMSMCDSIALIDPPRIHCMPVDAMRDSRLIERLFGIDITANHKYL